MYCVLDPSADYVVSTYDVRTYVLVFVIALANHHPLQVKSLFQDTGVHVEKT